MSGFFQEASPRNVSSRDKNFSRKMMLYASKQCSSTFLSCDLLKQTKSTSLSNSTQLWSILVIAAVILPCLHLGLRSPLRHRYKPLKDPTFNRNPRKRWLRIPALKETVFCLLLTPFYLQITKLYPLMT